jgi:hypothetical protein
MNGRSRQALAVQTNAFSEDMGPRLTAAARVMLTAQASAINALFSGERRDHGTIKRKRDACRRNRRRRNWRLNVPSDREADWRWGWASHVIGPIRISVILGTTSNC